MVRANGLVKAVEAIAISAVIVMMTKTISYRRSLKELEQNTGLIFNS